VFEVFLHFLSFYFSSRLRESTLMSLMFIVDKLDEATLQDRLVRCIVNLQNDGEASIRTNATIFLGKIASKLKESVR
jgi:SCY1-like protein 1